LGLGQGRYGTYLKGVLRVSLGFLLGLGISSIFIFISSPNPIGAYIALLDGAFGSPESISENILKATPLILTGLAVAVAFKANVYNIGAEGQMYVGAIVTATVALTVPVIPSFAFIPLLVITSFLGGALWASIAGFLKVKYGVNEIITTLLMNWIPFYVIQYLVTGPLQEKHPLKLPETDPLPEAARLIRLIPTGPYRVHLGIAIAVISCVLLYFFLWRTSRGLEFRATGLAPEASRSLGIDVGRRMMQAMLISGGLAAFAGMSEVAGTLGRLKLGSSNILGYGYAGILVALIANLHPIWVIPSGIFFSTLIVGSESMQRAAGVPISVVYIVEGIFVLCILIVDVLAGRRKIPWLT